MRSRQDAGSAGFTLIEVIVALAIVATVLVSIAAVFASSVRGIGAIERRTALIETTRAIETGLPDRDQLKPGSLSGETSGHQWRVDVSLFPTRPLGERQSDAWRPLAVAIGVRSPLGSMIKLQTVRLQRKPAP